ncbi:hypothetical protein GCM10009860_20370 [Microbacterium mitrae]
MPGGARIPQSETCHTVGVDVFWRALKLREHRQLMTSGFGIGVCNLEQNGTVTLHDQGAISHNVQFYSRF